MHRTRVIRILALVVAAAASAFAGEGLAAARGGDREHVVSRSAIEGRLEESAAERARNVAAVESLLASPIVRQTADALGVDVGRARKALPALTDDELRDLAARSAALETDPAAGMAAVWWVLLGAAVTFAVLYALAMSSLD